MIIDSVAGGLADVVTAAAVLVAVLLWISTRSWNPTMPVFLELLLAAGLLRLGAAGSWRAIAAAAGIVVIRTLVKTAGQRRPGHLPRV